MESVSKYIFVVDRIQFLMGTVDLGPCFLAGYQPGATLLLEAFCIPFHVPHSLSSCQQWQIESVLCFKLLASFSETSHRKFFAFKAQVMWDQVHPDCLTLRSTMT